MKKLVKIELIDGSIITTDVTEHKELKRLPIGTPANDTSYAMMCQGIAMGGWTAPDPDLGPKKYKHIAPSQIKTVSLEFID